MKKKMIAALMTGVMALSLAACGGANDAPVAEAPAASTEEAAPAEDAQAEGEDNVYAKALAESPALSDGVLTVGTNATFPPFEYIDGEGAPTGFDVAMMNEIGSRMGVTIEIEDMDFDGIVAAIGNKVDVGASGMTITEERKEAVAFSDSYYDATQCVLLPVDSTIETKEQLAEAIIDVQSGTTGELVARDLNDANTVSVKSFNQAVTDLLNGKADAVVIDTAPAAAFKAQHPDELKVVDGQQYEFDVEQYGIAVPKDDAALLDAINEALSEMKADGTYDKLVDEWINNYEAE